MMRKSRCRSRKGQVTISSPIRRSHCKILCFVSSSRSLLVATRGAVLRVSCETLENHSENLIEDVQPQSIKMRNLFERGKKWNTPGNIFAHRSLICKLQPEAVGETVNAIKHELTSFTGHRGTGFMRRQNDAIFTMSWTAPVESPVELFYSI